MPLSPLMLGFEDLELFLQQMTRSAEGFPPYNVQKLSETSLRISLAVAGYAPEDLSVELQNNQLIIQGKTQPQNAVFLHKGIAGRSFVKSFILAEGLEVKKVFLNLGLLHIDLCRIQPYINTKKFNIENKNATEILKQGKGKHNA